MVSVGILRLEVCEGHLTHDVKKLSRMDPYMAMSCRDQQWRSAKDKNGSKKPKWHDQVFVIDVKYIGDEIYYKCLDEDRGKDELVGSHNAKISTFTAEPQMDMWMDIFYKGKEAGRIRMKSTWEPIEEKPPTKEESDDMMAKAQAAIKRLSQKKKELEAEWEEIKARTAKHEAEHEERLAALGDDDGEVDLSKFDAAVERANQHYEETMASIQKQRELAEEGKADFEASIVTRTREAAEAREARDAEIAAMEEKAGADKAERDAANEAAAAEAGAAHEEKVNRARHRLEAELEQDQEAHDAIKEEISEIAKRMLAINEKIQQKLQALADL